ncbi:histidine kinase dimerization/phospho-acceptor domain-containing protein, partial [Limnohabitans sp. Rim47]
ADLQDVFEKLPGLEEQVIKVQQERAPLMREIELNNQVFLSIVSPICTGEDQVLGVVIVLQDITNRWRLVQLQKELIANVSHEFKTPLTSIKGFVELMLDHKIKDEVAVQNSLKIIHSETLRLIRMVNDLLKMARMESLRLRKEPTDLL